MPDAARKTKFQVKRETTYRDLVHAGMQVLAEKGYAATRVEDVVERTGQTKGAFYFHFKNKLDLLHHVIRYREELRAGWRSVPEALDPSTTTLEEALFAGLTEIDRRLEHTAWVLVMVDAYHQTRGDAEAEQLFAETYERWLDESTDHIELLKQRGWVTSTVPSRDLAIQLFALGEGFSIHHRIYGMPYDRVVIDAYLRLLA